MEDKCPKCGSEAVTVVNWQTGSPTFDFACGTEQLPGGLVRGNDCYETELATLSTEFAALKELLRRAVKTLQVLLKPIESCMEANKPSHKGKTPDGSPFRQLSVTVTLSYNQIKQTQAFLTIPEVVKAMEEKQ